MAKRPRTTANLIAAMVVGLLATGLAIISAWTGADNNLDDGRFQRFTAHGLDKVRAAISVYQSNHSVPPASLGLLPEGSGSPMREDEHGAMADFWGHPLTYSVRGSRYELVSYGRDGKPGGSGLDSDLLCSDRVAPRAIFSLGDFLREPAAKGMLSVGIGAGVVTLLLTFFIFDPGELRRDGWPAEIAKLICTLVFAVIMASFGMAFHIQSGH